MHCAVEVQSRVIEQREPHPKEVAMREAAQHDTPADSLSAAPDAAGSNPAATHPVTRAFDVFAASVMRVVGTPVAFGVAVITVLVWAVSGPLFHFSDGWQLVINTGTTIITFLMVFLIQQGQNKDSVALHLKLNELLASHRAANNQMIGIEAASEEELRRLAAAYLQLASKAAGKRAESVDVDACVEKKADAVE
jgi:low affinity Fe/Cu permease